MRLIQTLGLGGEMTDSFAFINDQGQEQNIIELVKVSYFVVLILLW
jgi:hypothetical protein